MMALYLLSLIFMTGNLHQTGAADDLFICDGVRSISSSFVNDDYCDCHDGSDEYSTPACSHRGGTFTCGFNNHDLPDTLKEQIPTSRVLDSVCDCCDGSDEPNGLCEDTCGPAMSELRSEAINKYLTAVEGLRLADMSAESARQVVLGWTREAQPSDGELSVKLEQLMLRLKLYLAQEERTERKERIQLARAQSAESKEDENNVASVALDEESKAKPHKKRGAPVVKSLDEIMNLSHTDDRSGRTVELKNYVEKRQSGRVYSESGKLDDLRGSTLFGGSSESANAMRFIGYAAATVLGLIISPIRVFLELFDHVSPLLSRALRASLRRMSLDNVALVLDRYADEGVSTFSPYLDSRRYSLARAASFWLESVRMSCGWICEAVWDAPVTVFHLVRPEIDLSYERPEAGLLRKALPMVEQALEAERKRENSAISKYQKFLDLDLGPKRIYAPLAESCFDLEPSAGLPGSDALHFYRLCLFNEITQRSESNSKGVLLGKFSGWESPHSIMEYSNGARCQGKAREAKVSISCGREPKVVKAYEPETCKYILEFEAPQACTKGSVEVALAKLQQLGVDPATLSLLGGK